jgi:hypothetical protein
LKLKAVCRLPQEIAEMALFAAFAFAEIGDWGGNVWAQLAHDIRALI